MCQLPQNNYLQIVQYNTSGAFNVQTFSAPDTTTFVTTSAATTSLKYKLPIVLLPSARVLLFYATRCDVDLLVCSDSCGQSVHYPPCSQQAIEGL